jgi:hypothetical protein
VFFFLLKVEKDLLSAVGGAQHAGIHRKPDAVSSFFLSSFDEVSVETSESTAVKCSGLFGWNAFHRHLDQLDTNGRSAKTVFEEIGVDWIKKALNRRSSVFHLFLKYWLEHCQLVEDAEEVIPHLDFRLIVPYRSLVRSFLLAFASESERPRAMTDCAVALLGVGERRRRKKDGMGKREDF